MNWLRMVGFVLLAGGTAIAAQNFHSGVAMTQIILGAFILGSKEAWRDE